MLNLGHNLRFVEVHNSLAIVSLIQFEFETELFGKEDVTTDIVYSQSLQQLDTTKAVDVNSGNYFYVPNFLNSS